MAGGGIFFSYRRDDSSHATGRLVEHLKNDFTADQLFIDIDTISPGLDFEKVLRDRLKICDVLLAVIGPSWLEAKDAHGRRRLDNPEDFVRREIAAALQRHDVHVVPVLVSKALMPRAEDLPDDLKPLATRQNYELRDDRFAADATELMARLAAIVSPRALWMRRIGGGAAAIAGIAGLVWLAGSWNSTSLPPDVLKAKAVDLCTEATEVTARLASSTDTEAWSKTKNRFWELYWGPLYIIETAEKKQNSQEHSELENAMVLFGRILGDQNSPSLSLPASTLTQPSLDVALACSELIQSK